ncbi:4Fe-4S binding protein [Agathobaculum sp.]|uniref:4Fe-4S binding protein n=1 Tax=Agathobaculum sp. TaxID=2048138 RepID=UPI0027BA0561|nr:4Fe-4S binding protein [Agathobaculum sp.]
MGKLKQHARTLVQFIFTALTNGYAAGYAQGSIYRGAGKFVCVPGLNCYSCPGAVGSCPIGSLQAVITSREHKFTFYVLGFLLLFGALFGRLVCGWLCPFGLVQDLLHKIPFVKKLRRLPGERALRCLKYAVLVGFVVILPLTVLDIVGQGQPWFCKYICPSGTLFAGIPLIAANPPLRAALGWLFTWKAAILIVLVLLSIVLWRPFCRYLCPLGAIYGLFNPVAVYRFRIDTDKCTACGACQKACKLDIAVYRTPNSPECVRCGDCRRSCPHGAICTANTRPGAARDRQATHRTSFPE